MVNTPYLSISVMASLFVAEKFIFYNLETLSSIATIYANASIAGKQRIIREVFNNTLYITKAGYETLEINPLLHQNQLIINGLHIT